MWSKIKKPFTMITRANWNAVGRRFLAAPWIILPVVLLGYIGYQESHLVELIAWQVGAIALAPPLAISLDAWLFPDATPRKLRKQGFEVQSKAMIIAQARRTLIVVAIIIAIALGV